MSGLGHSSGGQAEVCLAVVGVVLHRPPGAPKVHGLKDGDGNGIRGLPLVAELQTYIGDLKASAQGKGEDPLASVGSSALSHPAGEVVGIVEVCQIGNVGVIIGPSERVASADRDPVGGVDELRQAVARAAVEVVAGVVRRSPAQGGVGEGGGGDEGQAEEEEEQREERGRGGRGGGQEHHVIQPVEGEDDFKRKPWE